MPSDQSSLSFQVGQCLVQLTGVDMVQGEKVTWSKVKRINLIGSLSGPNFAIRTTKMDRSRTEFTDLCS